ncbi:hypothetical protein P389DRAFT_8826 [Cystobasidium minutum MCA 4210]|uniref:uncharacterized protein n=1 Tax=Cystobasidium minutum MCA 4210 TaxID=1397322 RepID=UPI0034CE6984|eukprot:jgi/Rhomi1/8826/CE8825_65
MLLTVLCLLFSTAFSLQLARNTTMQDSCPWDSKKSKSNVTYVILSKYLPLLEQLLCFVLGYSFLPSFHSPTFDLSGNGGFKNVTSTSTIQHNLSFSISFIPQYHFTFYFQLHPYPRSFPYRDAEQRPVIFNVRAHYHSIALAINMERRL